MFTGLTPRSGVGQRVVQRRAHGRHLGVVALLGRGARAVRVNLGGAAVFRAGKAGAQAKVAARVVDDAVRHDLRTDDLALLVGGGDVGHLLHLGDDRLLEIRLRVVAVADQVEAVRDALGLGGLAVTRGLGRAELGIVGVGGFVQVDVQHEPIGHRPDEIQQRGRFGAGAVGHEAAVGVDGQRVPALHALVGPGTDAGHHQHVDAAVVVGQVLFDELQRAVHTAGLVAVHAAGDQRGGQRFVPLLATDRVQREIAVGAVVEHGVGHYVGAGAKVFDACQDINGVAAAGLLAGAPLGAFLVAPG